jgi:hypothetical protein
MTFVCRRIPVSATSETKKGLWWIRRMRPHVPWERRPGDMADTKGQDYLDHVTSERREFVKKMAKMAFVVPVVVSVSMLDQRLDMSTAMGQTGNQTRPVP